MTMSSASVVFTPSGKRGSFPHGTRVLQAARSLGVDLDSVCGGRGICARCQVIHTTGEFSKHGLVSAATHLSPFDATEEKLVRKTTRLKSGRRLGCTAQILGDCVIDVPPESSREEHRSHNLLGSEQYTPTSVRISVVLFCERVFLPSHQMGKGGWLRKRDHVSKIHRWYG